jgi:hypothetical protein
MTRAYTNTPMFSDCLKNSCPSIQLRIRRGVYSFSYNFIYVLPTSGKDMVPENVNIARISFFLCVETFSMIVYWSVMAVCRFEFTTRIIELSLNTANTANTTVRCLKFRNTLRHGRDVLRCMQNWAWTPVEIQSHDQNFIFPTRP